MHEFIQKYASAFSEKQALEVVHHKIKDARHYFSEGKKFEAVKAMKEAHAMLGDMIECIEGE